MLSIAKGRLTRLGGQELIHLRESERQVLLVNHVGHAIFVIDGERLAPVALTREDSVAQTIVDLDTTYTFLFDVLLHGSYCLFHLHAVEEA